MDTRTQTSVLGTLLLLLGILAADDANAFQASPLVTPRNSNPVKQHQLHMMDPNLGASIGDSSMHVSLVEGLLKPAHEHTQPLFGAPDKYLSAGHSIAPNLKALAGQAGAAATPVDQLPAVAQTAAKNGWTIIDAAKFEGGGGSVLPGFVNTGHILGVHADNIPEASMASFTAQVFASAKFLAVLEALPKVAFAFVFIDFLFLRNDADLYKEDIEEEYWEVAAETAAVTGVRLAAFAAIGLFTVVALG